MLDSKQNLNILAEQFLAVLKLIRTIVSLKILEMRRFQFSGPIRGISQNALRGRNNINKNIIILWNDEIKFFDIVINKFLNNF